MKKKAELKSLYVIKWNSTSGDGFLVHRGESIDAVSQELQKVLEEEHGCTIEKPGFLSIDVLPEQLYRSLIKKNDNAKEED